MALRTPPLWGIRPSSPGVFEGEFELSDDSLESEEEQENDLLGPPSPGDSAALPSPVMEDTGHKGSHLEQDTTTVWGTGMPVNRSSSSRISNNNSNGTKRESMGYIFGTAPRQDSRSSVTTAADSRMQSGSRSRETSTKKLQDKPPSLSQKLSSSNTSNNSSSSNSNSWTDMPSPAREAILKRLQQSHHLLQQSHQRDSHQQEQQQRRDRATPGRNSVGSRVSQVCGSSTRRASSSKQRLRELSRGEDGGSRGSLCPHGLRYRSLCCFCSSPDPKRDAAATGGVRLLQPTVASLMHSASNILGRESIFNRRTSSAPAVRHTITDAVALSAFFATAIIVGFSSQPSFLLPLLLLLLLLLY